MTWAPGDPLTAEEQRVVDMMSRAMEDPDFHRRLELQPGEARPLKPWQVHLVNLIERKMAVKDGSTLTVRISRQAGKNEIAATVHDRHLLRKAGTGGNIVRAAPTFKPQIVTSKLRLETILERDPLMDRKAFRWREGYIATYGRATVTFMSSDPNARQEGATADELLDIDEAHLTNQEVYSERLAPMTASTNASKVMFGVAGQRDDLLYATRERNMELGKMDDNIQITAERLSEIDEVYRGHYEARIEELGEGHPVIQTQYKLVDIDSLGGAFTHEHQKKLFSGEHPPMEAPLRRAGVHTVAVIDLAGEEEQPQDVEEATNAKGRDPDCAVVMIGEVDDTLRRADKPMLRIVKAYRWVGLPIQAAPGDQRTSLQEMIMQVLGVWRPEATVVDARGLGISTASWLARVWNGTVVQYHATLPSTTEDLYWTWAYINTGQMQMYADDGSPEYRQLKREVGWVRAKYSGEATSSRVNLQKPSKGQKIDMVKALTYLRLAAQELEGSYVWGMKARL